MRSNCTLLKTFACPANSPFSENRCWLFRMASSRDARKDRNCYDTSIGWLSIATAPRLRTHGRNFTPLLSRKVRHSVLRCHSSAIWLRGCRGVEISPQVPENRHHGFRFSNGQTWPSIAAGRGRFDTHPGLRHDDEKRPISSRFTVYFVRRKSDYHHYHFSPLLPHLNASKCVCLLWFAPVSTRGRTDVNHLQQKSFWLLLD